MAIAVEKGKASSPARIAGRLGNPKDILFFAAFFSAAYSSHQQFRLQSGDIDGGVGADRSERAFAFHSGGSSLVNGALRQTLDEGLGSFSAASGDLWVGI